MAELQTKTGFLSIQGAPLYYEIAGQGETIFLLHAGIADSRMWDAQFATFAQQYQVVRYDLRGFGQSQFPDGPFAHQEDPVALLHALNIEKAHVIGISFGAKVALDFALAYPIMLSSLILIAPSVGGDVPSDLVQKFWLEEEALLQKGDLSAASWLNVRFWVDGPNRRPEQVDASVRERVYQMQYHAFTVPEPEHVQEVSLQPPAIERLSEVHMPTLVLVGDQDLPEKVNLAQKLATQIVDAQLRIIPNVAHMPTMEQPEVFNRLALDFLMAQSSTR
jgi:3-oxoadipate enol-lactonase